MNENEENMQPQPCETQTETPQEPVKAESEKAEHGKQGKKWKEEIEKLKSESADFKDKWMRSAAEFENFKRRNADTRRTSYLEGRADVVLKVLPIGDNLERALTMCDENTICIVPIAGVTWTGLDDDIEGLDKALDEYNAKTGYEIPIHVDAASGGFILPFLKPEKKWDFRLKWVLSISTSGHKYGLVYPGLGWVVWKDKKYLPDEMSFSVNYLGANITQVGLNFSRPAAQILGQYYNFIRLGFEGYKEVQQNSMDIAKYCHEQIGKMPCFRNYAKEVVNPLFIWMMDPEYDKKAKWTLFDLQAALQQSGWMVPAYTMPKNIDEMIVMRIVVRQGMSRDMADMLLGDIRNAVAEFEKLRYPTPSRIKYENKEHQKGKVYTH